MMINHAQWWHLNYLLRIAVSSVMKFDYLRKAKMSKQQSILRGINSSMDEAK